MNTPQTSEATKTPPALEGFADANPTYENTCSSSSLGPLANRDLLVMLTALCAAAPRNGLALETRAKEANDLAHAILKVVDVGGPSPATPESPMLERGTIGASMLQRQLGEANGEIGRLRDALSIRNAEAQAEHERVVALETELRQTKEELVATKAGAATSTGTSGPAPRPPKGKTPETKPEE